MVTSAAQIYGKIGAAKSFTKVANALGMEIEGNEARISELRRELSGTQVGSEESREIQRDIKRLLKKNKMLSKQQRASQNATEFLSKLADTLDIGMNVIVDWMSKFIVVFMPELEVSVKMLLLSNIKKMVSCSVDPMIPDYWRMEGVLINEAQVDPRKMLRLDPFSKYGKYQYFGCYKDKDYKHQKNKHELARADDMNAFLWYAKYNAKFVSPVVISPNDMPQTFSGTTSGTTFFNTHEFYIPYSGTSFIEGTSFKNVSSENTIFLLEKREDLPNYGIRYTILPASDTWTGITWYKDRTSLNGFEEKNVDYNKSKPLFNIEFLGEYDGENPYRYGNFRFRILPKPFSTAGGFIVDLYNNMNTMAGVVGSTASKELIGDEINNSEIPKYQYPGIQSPIPYYARFDSKGDYDKRGRYSVNTRQYSVIKLQDDTDNGIITYGIYGPNNNIPIAYLNFLKKNKTFIISQEMPNAQGKIVRASQELIASLISECYFGNTVYEFNYDYVMSMKLFDEKAITSSIIDSLLHTRFNIDLNNINPFLRNNGEYGDTLSDTDQIYIDSYVDRLIERMIDTEEYEFTDCFYTFSNEDYEEMERETADKVANMAFDVDNGQGAVNAIYDELNAYDADATLNERVESIKNALISAVSACGFDDSNGLDTNSTTGRANRSSSLKNSAGERSDLFRMIKTMLEILVSSVVNAILTPKVLILIQVNRMMMMQSAFDRREESYTVKDVLNGMSGMLKGVIRNIVDNIHRELLRMILERLSDIMAAYLKKLGTEYAMKWVNILKQLLACFKRDRSMAYADTNGNSLYSGTINSIIDQVDYADLEILADEIIPNTNPC